MTKFRNKISIEEGSLISLLKNKDETGFDILYNNYSNAIYGIIVRMLRSEDEAADMQQEAFIKIWNNIEKYESQKGKLFTWMANITRNLVIDRIRSADYKNHNLNNFVRDDNTQFVDNEHKSSLDIGTIGLRGMVTELKPNLQVLIKKIYFEGYTQSDLAEELGIPLGTLKTRVRAAIKELKKQFN